MLFQKWKSAKMTQANLVVRQIEKEKNLRILLHVDEPLKPTNQIWQFQKKKARNFAKIFQKSW